MAVQRGGSKKGYCSTAPIGMVVGPEKCSDHGDQSNKLRWNRDFSVQLISFHIFFS